MKKKVVQLEKDGEERILSQKNLLLISSLEIEKKIGGKRSQLGKAEKKAKGKQH